ncbi:hypothetical protein N7468_003122 [Penicillium chermesinum]|uniref:Uncharacterized protein n=1 Tax=Penicillium chermesinum TaxID=63820 RepID=A0A9W9P5V3_9EURO|nr:uncharacterized protein N7468_003122 [Penicillium chermesinum]KAJ5238503.1 hypothetical protein N7468_003122 [Penicillium chermesinum]KAJ6164158.1 hypothetical protein N7470_002830 [Penicillium chermesinum]
MNHTPFEDELLLKMIIPTMMPTGMNCLTSTPGYYLDRECTPSAICPSPEPEQISDPLNFMPEVDRDEVTWDGQYPNYVHYRRVTINKRGVAKNTDQDLALLPRSYWP